MRLWSIQTTDVWDQLSNNGVYYAEWCKISQSLDMFEQAYYWMARQMKERGLPLDGRAPIWAWHTWQTKRPCPDLRARGHLETGTQGIRMVLDVPDSLVLLSDFETWHFVLNRSFLSYNEQEFDKAYTEDEIQESWKRVFEFDKGDPKWLGSPHRAIQATLPMLRREWVQSVKYFRGR